MKHIMLLFISALLVIAGCSEEEKTQPVIVDVGDAEPVSPEDIEPEDRGMEDVSGEVTKEIVKESDAEPIPQEDNESAEPEEEDNTKTIIIEDVKFKPDDITIPAGTKVIWKHEDDFLDKENIIHMIMVYPIGKRSDRMFYGDTFNVTFDEPGEYDYIDIIFKERMRGKITVE